MKGARLVRIRDSGEGLVYSYDEYDSSSMGHSLHGDLNRCIIMNWGLYIVLNIIKIIDIGSASFLLATLMSPHRTRKYCMSTDLVSIIIN